VDLPRSVEALKQGWECFCRTVARPAACPVCCGTRIWWNGFGERSASVRLGDETFHVSGIRFRRVLCADSACRHRWSLLPPGLAPRRHFQSCVVSAAVQEYLFAPGASQESTAHRHGCSRRALGRWIGWLAGLVEPAVIQERILAAQGEPILAPVRAVARLARKARSQARSKVLEAAALVLCHLEALAAALGLAPVGLRSVLETLAPIGARQSTQARPLLPEFARRRPTAPSETLLM